VPLLDLLTQVSAAKRSPSERQRMDTEVTSTGVNIALASDCAECAAGHRAHCTCSQKCGHPRCTAKDAKPKRKSKNRD
jgi:hypothetical protein